MEQLEPDVVAIANECTTRAPANGTVEFMTAIGDVVHPLKSDALNSFGRGADTPVS
jgi:hypothetical protein